MAASAAPDRAFVPGMMVRLIRMAVVLAATGLLGGCGAIGYYAQAIGGHLEVVRLARPVADVLADPVMLPALRDKLANATAAREFASRELHLPDNGSYRRYADLGRPFVVWNVIAAPEFSVTPEEACFPVAGCVAYRGWYSEVRARDDAAERQAKGFDVRVGGVPAYSTLGWFDDPLLNTFLGYPDAEVARLIFHELAHQVLYVPGDSSFNESFAVAVEEEGVRRWLDWRANAAERERYLQFDARRRQFVELISRYRERLKAYYRDTASWTSAQLDERRAGKAKLFAALDADYEQLKQSWGGFAGYDRIMGRSPVTLSTAASATVSVVAPPASPNNALLASIVTYSEWLPAFRNLLTRQGGDMAAFYREAKRLSAMERAARERALREFM
jgi:predicted aminopeptidase